MAYQFILSDDDFAVISAIAADRKETPQALILEVAQALREQDRQRAHREPLTEEEFEAALGLKPEDLPELDRKADELLASLSE